MLKLGKIYINLEITSHCDSVWTTGIICIYVLGINIFSQTMSMYAFV